MSADGDLARDEGLFGRTDEAADAKVDVGFGRTAVQRFIDVVKLVRVHGGCLGVQRR